MVAPSYQSIGFTGEPYTVNGKQYVMLNNGRRARWYDEAEFRKAFPKASMKENELGYDVSTLHNVLGFGERDFIYILKGDTYPHKDYIYEKGGRYHKIFGWYFIEGIEVPELPEEIEIIKLPWELVTSDGQAIKPDDELREVIENLMYPTSVGEFIGNIGDRLVFDLTVIETHNVENFYGKTTIHHFKDERGNYFIWTTASQHWEVGDHFRVKGTVKTQEIQKGKKINIINRCVIVK